MSEAKKTREDYLAFLAEYEALCRRHGIIISACGCCGSPWLQQDDQLLADHFSHLADELERDAKSGRV